MPPKRQNPDIGTAFSLLCDQLGRALKKTGSIRLLNTTTENLRAALATAQTYQMAVLGPYFVEIVSLLDGSADACRRLEPKTYIALLETILQAGFSRTQERGLYLLAASLSCDCRAWSASSPKTLMRRKAAIGKGCLWALLRCFTNPAEDFRVRRWVGLLISNLLENCADNITVFEADPQDGKRKLGNMIMEEPNDILRIVCGQLLNTLIVQDVPPETLWPFNTDSEVYSNFPFSSQRDKCWNLAFQNYVDQFSAGLISQEDTGALYFPSAVTTEGHAFNAADCSINLLVDSELLIYVDSGESGIETYLDVPVHLVSEVTISEILLDDGTRAPDQPLIVIVTLNSIDNALCYLNALPVTIKEVHISVHDDKMAEIMGLEINNASKRPKMSQTSDTIGVGRIKWPKMKSNRSPESSNTSHKTDVSNSQDIADEVPPKDAITHVSLQYSKSHSDFVTRHSSPPAHYGIFDKAARKIEVDGSMFYQPRGLPDICSCLGPDENRLLGEKFCNAGPPPNSPVKYPQVNGAVSQYNQTETIVNVSMQGSSISSHLNIPMRSNLGEDSARILAPMSILGQEQGSSVAFNISSKAETDATSRGKINSKRNRRMRPESETEQFSPSNAITGKRTSIPTTSEKEKVIEAPLMSSITPEMEAIGVSGYRSRDLSTQSSPASQITATTLAQAINSRSKSIVAEAAFRILKRPTENDNVIATYPAKLLQRLEGIEDLEYHIKDPVEFLELRGGQRRIENQQQKVMARSVREPPPPKFHTAPMAEDHENESQRGVVPEGTATRRNPEEQLSNSPGVFSRTRRATALLNSVLSHDPVLLDDRAIRKTVLFGFTSQGPSNQGSSIAKKLFESPRKAEKTQSNYLKMNSDINERTLKRKRSIDVVKDKEIVKRHRVENLQRYIATGASVQNEPDGQIELDGPYEKLEQGEQDVSIAYYDVPKLRPIYKTLVTGRQKDFKLQRPRVDENGSPHAPTVTNHQREQYRVIADREMRSERAAEKIISNGAHSPHRYPDNEDICLPLKLDLRFPHYGASAASKRLQPSPRDRIETAHHGTSRQGKSMSNDMSSSCADGDFVACHRLRDFGDMRAFVSSPGDRKDISGRNSKQKLIAEDQPGRDTQKVIAREVALASPIVMRRRDQILARTVQYGYQDQKVPSAKTSLQPQFNPSSHTSEDQDETLVEAQDFQIEEGGISSEQGVESNGSEQELTDQLSNEIVNQIPLNIWREALKPHQRDMLDTLCKISSDLVRYLICNEEAIAGIIEEYARYGNELIQKYGKKQKTDCQSIQKTFDRAKKIVEDECQQSHLDIIRITREIKAQPVGTNKEDWQRQQRRLMKLITEGKEKLAI